MSGQIIIGVGRELRTVPDEDFQNAMKHLPERTASRLAFMSADHHVVRDFAVREMPRQKQPLSPRQIARVTGFDVSHVTAILEDLERNLFFLVRDANGNVSWAFPITTHRTPHRLSFSGGEKTFGA
jgi:hypothetical protein